MKNLWDAVNELRGDLDYTYLFSANSDKYLFYCSDDGDYICGASEDENNDERLVCTIAEFNSLIEGMKTNFGTSKSYNYYKAHFEGIATDKLEPISKPLVYTQEMADNGVKLKKGMKAMLRGFEREILLGPDSDGDYITMNGEGSYDFDSINQFRPIYTRTKKEKAIDEINDELSITPYSVRSALELAYDKWVGE